MKKLLLLMSIALLLVACDKKDDDLSKGKLDPNAMITIKAGAVTKSGINGWDDEKGEDVHLTVKYNLSPIEIVTETMNMTFRSHYAGSTYYDVPTILDRGFGDNQRDFDIPALLMFGTDIIETDGRFIKDFIYGQDFYLVNKDLDTIGYIPQTVIDNARRLIEIAYEDKNYTEVYKVFDEAFTFLPISE